MADNAMIKPRIIIITSGILVLIGIAITVYQSQTTSENLVNQQNAVESNAKMIISKNMDPLKNQKGVYSVQANDLKSDDSVWITVTNPSGVSVITKQMTKNTIQDTFTVTSNGNYTLQIDNQGKRSLQILGIIGYYPENIELADISGFIILIAGLSGLAIGMMYLVKNRAKT